MQVMGKPILQAPEVFVTEVNSTIIKKYEKFEIFLELRNVKFKNPFDPDDIDLYALFQAPSGKEIPVSYTHLDVYKRQRISLFVPIAVSVSASSSSLRPDMF